jgi:hypothetical protein
MANKYIGARYVPKFDGGWDKAKSYEPLVIVEYQGDSYTSKTYVPSNVDISNTKYWALTGNYNAQVEDYRKDVIMFKESVLASVEESIASNTQIVNNSNTARSKQVEGFNNIFVNSNIQAIGSTPLAITDLKRANEAKWHTGFPTIASEGDTIIIAYRRGSGHETNDGVICYKKSLDGGATWDTEKVLFTPTQYNDARDPNFIKINETQLMIILPLMQYDESGINVIACTNEVYLSNDFGDTWVKRTSIIKNTNTNWYQIVRGTITKMPTGRILVPVWVGDIVNHLVLGAFIVYTDDLGGNWNVGSWITHNPVTETSIEFDNYGRLYAVMRHDTELITLRDKPMLISYSDDNGNSWSDPYELPICGHAPHLMKIDDGLLLSWRNTNMRQTTFTTDKHTVNIVKLKNGGLNSQVYNVFESSTGDIGYPWCCASGDNVYMTFYVINWSSDINRIYFKKMSLRDINELSFLDCGKSKHLIDGGITRLNQDII